MAQTQSEEEIYATASYGSTESSGEREGAQSTASLSKPRRQHGCQQKEDEMKRHVAETKNPKGGLTQAGRDMFRRKTGASLKPGVKKPIADMTAEEMRRKGSWAVRFYGRTGRLPPLKDKQGAPTRFVLTAAAWGEPVPKTAASARKIAAKGRRLLKMAKARRKTR